MKKILKVILLIICWVLGLIFLYETIQSFLQSDPWGLTFAFVTLPSGIISILFLLPAISLTKEFLHKK